MTLAALDSLEKGQGAALGGGALRVLGSVLGRELGGEL